MARHISLSVLWTIISVLVVWKIDFTSGSLDDKFLCTEKFCQNYRDEKGCPSVNEACKIQNSTHNGRTFPSPTECNCCDFCLVNLVEGADCTIGTPGSPLPTQICGPGLSCTAHDGRHATCESMNSKCYEAQRKHDLDKQIGDIGDLAPRPRCDRDGKYEPTICIPGQTCYCVNEEGDRIFGESVEEDDTELKMKCECSRLADTARNLIEEEFPVVTARCNAFGSYDALQCMSDTCFCVSEKGAIMIPEDFDQQTSANITLGLNKLPCFRRSLYGNITSMENYLRPCEQKLFTQIEEKYRLMKEKGIIVMDYELEKCQANGWYPRVRESEKTKYCSDEQGELIENFEVPKNEAANMNCNCARARKLLMENNAIEIPKCDRLGNYQRVACRRGNCYCVDSNGIQESQEVKPEKIKELHCCQDEKCDDIPLWG